MSYFEDENNVERSESGQEFMERYTYSFEQTAPPSKRGKRGFAARAAAVVICGAMLAVGGGFAGSLLTYRSLQNADTGVRPSGESGAPQSSMSNATSPIANVNPSGGQMTLTELFDGANPAVVAVSTETAGRNIFGQSVKLPASGSGFVISEDGYIATNCHVISGATVITVIMHDGVKYPATLVGSDTSTDIAVLKIDAKDLSYLSFGDSDMLKVGQQVAAIGNPLGELANSFTVGYISALDRELNIDGIPRHMLQTDASINSGNSGGPLLDLTGRVIGVVTAKSVGQNVEGLGFAIPSNRISGIVNQLIDKGYVPGRAVMGVEVSGNGSQVRVESVKEGGAAEKAGVLAGDIILTAGSKNISAVSDLTSLLAGMSPGDKLVLNVQRDGANKTLTLTLDEYRPDMSAIPGLEDLPGIEQFEFPDGPQTWRFPWDGEDSDGPRTWRNPFEDGERPA